MSSHDPSRWRHEDSIHESLLIRLKPGVLRSAIDLHSGGHGARQGNTIGLSEAFKLHVSQDSEGLAKKLVDAGLVEYAEPDVMRHQCWIPNDTDYPSQGNLTIMDCPNAWNITRGSATYPVAIIDKGVDTGHSEFTGKLLTGFNQVTGTSTVTDTDGHGTGCAGIAGGATNNGSGTAAVGHDTKIVPVVTDLTDSSIAGCLDWIRTSSTARVVSMSFAGTGTPGSTIKAAVDNASAAGLIMCASAGNGSNNTQNYPASMKPAFVGGMTGYVIGVAGHYVQSAPPYDRVDFGGGSGSNYGAWCDIACSWNTFAPQWTTGGGGTASFQGTSASCPMVAAVCALILNVAPTLTPAQVLALLQANGDPVGSGFTGGPTKIINAYRAVDAARGVRGCGVSVGGF